MSSGRSRYKLCSLLLQYPDAELRALRPEIDAALAEVPRSAAVEALQRFLDWWTATEPLAAEQHYVETIDLHKRSGLYLTFYGQGDKRQRGAALLRLKQLYRSAGLPLEGSGELPDYLPVMLEFAAAARSSCASIAPPSSSSGSACGRAAAPTPSSSRPSARPSASSERVRTLVGKLIAGGPPTEQVGLEPFAPPDLMPAAEARR